jgi:hypothetical protein
MHTAKSENDGMTNKEEDCTLSAIMNYLTGR